MSRIICSKLLLIAFLSTNIAGLQIEDGNESPIVYNCDDNHLKQEIQFLKAAIFDLNSQWVSLSKIYVDTGISMRNLELKFEKLNNDTQHIEQEMEKISSRFDQFESRQFSQSVTEEQVLSKCYQNITSTLKDILDEERKTNLHIQTASEQIQHEINSSLRTNDTKSIESFLYDEHFNCLRNCTPNKELPKSCNDLSGHHDGIHLMFIPNSGLKPFYVYCRGQETLIQRREDGSVNFNRNWHDYKYGFGDLNGEHWLGLERIHAMTKNQNTSLWIWMTGFDLESVYADYSDFLIDDENNNYQFKSLGAFTGSSEVSDQLSIHVGMRFYTIDNDTLKNCARATKSGWWFNSTCDFGESCNLNRKYSTYADRMSPLGIQWESKKESLMYVHMSIY